ncbi:MAG: TatD family hydrolase [Xanthomonadales bacterium]|nr:TatD family hydrolase [Xanthomonadales bacterium]
MDLIDSHCHIDAEEFDGDRQAVLDRAAQAGVKRIIAPAIHAEGWPKLKALAEVHPQIVPVYGLHPMYLAHHRFEHLDALRDWVARERPCAIGECGLDHFLPELDPNRQRDILIGQLRLARDFDLPVILHARKAVDELMALLRRIGGLRGVVHSFSGSHQQAMKLCEMGFMLGLGGPVTYERANRLRGLVRELPLEHLLLETDAPDQPDSGHRGQRNEPAHLPHVLHAIAELRGQAAADIARQTHANALRLFTLDMSEPACHAREGGHPATSMR